MSIDRCMHSLFGVSKAAADLLVQEYGRYFDMPTVCFRGGCLTGPQHAGAQLHGFLAYLMRCTVTGDAVHRLRLRRQAGARQHPLRRRRARVRTPSTRTPRAGAVYNLGGGRASNCSMLEAIASCEQIAGRELDWTLSDQARIGDHRWWISDLAAFQATTRSWSLSTTSTASCARSTTPTSSSWAAVPREAVGRHPGAQRGGARSRRRSRAIVAGAARRGIELRDRRRRRRLGDGTADVVARARGRATRASAASRSHYRAASATRSAPGSSASRATRSRS